MNKRWISKTAMTLGVLTMVGSVGTGMINVSYAVEQNISGNAVSDDTSDRTITLWKYEISSSSDLGERGDGINPDPSKAPDLNGKKLMKGVKFEIIKVKAIGNANLTDPLKQVKGTDWEEDTSFAKMEGETDDGGKLTFDVSKLLGANDKKKADGIYLIREVPDKDGNYTYVNENGETKKVTKPMDPFFVHLPQTKRDDTGSLIYDVHVYPKNIVSEIELDKTVEGGKGYSIKAGNSFQWEATTKLPDGLYEIAPQDMTIPNYYDPETGQTSDRDFAAGDEIYASYFRVHDSISADLKLEDVDVYAIPKDGGAKVKLTNGTEYKVTLGSGGGAAAEIAPGSKVEDLTLGATKDVVVSLTKAGMKKLGVDEDTHLQVVYKVQADKDYNGTISNVYDVDYLLSGGTPTPPITSDKPEYFNGGLDIKKTDKAGADLSGAEFHIAESEDNAKANIFLASDGKSYRKTAGPGGTPAADILPSGVTYLTSTSNASGAASFDGLKLEWFKDSNGNGKQDPSIPEEATFTDKANIKKDYWVVETKSPDGYELLKTPQKVTVTLNSHEDSTIEVTVVNEPKTKLPFTGGTGTMLTIIIAIGAITIGTAAIAIDKKRRAV